MMRLDEPTWEKLEGLSRHFGVSIAEVIRQLVVHATRAPFPKRWHLALAERQAPLPRQQGEGRV